MTKLIILDVDGTLTPHRPSSTAPFSRVLREGVRERCAELRAGGAALVIASNQGGCHPSRVGRISVGAVHAHMRWLCRELGIAAYKFATKPPRKKPSPAMLLELMEQFGATAQETVFVGDAETDAQAAHAVGMRFVPAEEWRKGAK